MPPVESDADRAAFFDECEFADVVQTELGSFKGNFDNEYAAATFDTTRIGSRSPELECQTKDVERCKLDREGARLRINDIDYQVREHLPDGKGVSRLILTIA